MRIKKILAAEILDSRGNPTVEARVFLENGQWAKAAVPSGASTGTKEALELRDKNVSRYEGKGVLTACRNIETKINEALKGKEANRQEEIDKVMLELDGTENKEKLGANAILAVSLAVCRVAAQSQKSSLWKYIQEQFNLSSNHITFPVPMMNVINGGVHSDSGLDIQEFMVVPSGIKRFSERIRAGAEVYHQLKKIIAEDGYRVALGDEGGFAPRLNSNEDALKLICRAIEKANYKLGEEIQTGMDVAASNFYNQENGQYVFKLDNVGIGSAQVTALFREWIKKYRLELIEDPMSEFDWKGWRQFVTEVGNEAVVIGDDLIVTNQKILQEVIEQKACNAVLIKVNQIGTLSETIQCVKLAQKYNFKVAVSHRSGETTDEFIADLAVAVAADYVKFGAPARGERVCKYNRIMEIEREQE